MNTNHRSSVEAPRYGRRRREMAKSASVYDSVKRTTTEISATTDGLR